MIKIFAILCCAAILGGCTSTTSELPKPTVRVITADAPIPVIPEVRKPPKMELLPVEWVAPTDPNAILGLDEVNYKRMYKNWETLKAREAGWNMNVDAANGFIKKMNSKKPMSIVPAGVEK